MRKLELYFKDLTELVGKSSLSQQSQLPKRKLPLLQECSSKDVIFYGYLLLRCRTWDSKRIINECIERETERSISLKHYPDTRELLPDICLCCGRYSSERNLWTRESISRSCCEGCKGERIINVNGHKFPTPELTNWDYLLRHCHVYYLNYCAAWSMYYYVKYLEHRTSRFTDESGT